MTGVEPAAAAAATVAKRALSKAAQDDPKVDGILLEHSVHSGELEPAAAARARREAVKQHVRLKLWQPFGRMFGISKDYFEFQFEEEMADRLSDIPEEEIVEPRGSVAGPVLDGIGLTVDEPDLRDLYLNLLATASDRRVKDGAHPSFAQVIAQLDATEAKALAGILSVSSHPILEIRTKVDASTVGYQIAHSNVLDWYDETGTQVLMPRSETYVDNWVRLGLARVDFLTAFTAAERYQWAETHPLVLDAKSKFGDEHVECQNGVLVVTAFGRQFHSAAIAGGHSAH